jgi:Protein of unknown function (DUF3618)
MSSTDSDIRATVGTTWREDSHKDPEELEREIDETRADVQATLGALEQRLSAEHLLDLTIGRVRAHGGAFAGNLGSAARDNPVPLVLTSIGIAWLMMTRRNGNGARTPAPGIRERWRDARDRSREAGDEASDQWARTRDQASQTWHEARERLDSSRDAAAHATESVRESASRAASAARDQLARARTGVDYLMHEQPLVLGALGLAAGALIGAALPASDAESRMFGEASDRALDKAKAAGRESYRRARDRAREFTDRAKERLGTEERTGDAADRGRDYDRPEDYNRALERAASEKRTPKSKQPKNDPKSLGENPSEPHRRKRPSEGGVGKEHSSGGFSGEKSPNKTPPV